MAWCVPRPMMCVPVSSSDATFHSPTASSSGTSPDLVSVPTVEEAVQGDTLLYHHQSHTPILAATLLVCTYTTVEPGREGSASTTGTWRPRIPSRVVADVTQHSPYRLGRHPSTPQLRRTH